MRTTLTLDADVARLLREEARRRGAPFKQVVNEAIRAGLAPRVTRDRQKPYRVRAHRTTLRAGIDAASFNKLADELEDEAVTNRARASHR
jgi:hypothetical protein